MKVLAVVVTYNAMQWAERCFGSLCRTLPQNDIVVIDNGSTDSTVAFIRNQYPQVRLFHQTKNLGFGKANNIGLKIATEEDYDFALLLNQDAWIEDDMIQRLASVSNGRTLLSPVHLTGSGKAIDRNFRLHAIEREGLGSLLKGDPCLKKPTGLHPSYEINAACWLLPIDIIREIGGFNPLFFHYGEDVNYLNRLQYHHYGIAFLSGTHVFHDREQRGEKPVTRQVVYQGLIQIFVDIRHSVIVNIFRSLRYLLGLVHRSLREKRLVLIWYYVCAINNILFTKTIKIHKSRKNERKLQPNWL